MSFVLALTVGVIVTVPEPVTFAQNISLTAKVPLSVNGPHAAVNALKEPVPGVLATDRVVPVVLVDTTTTTTFPEVTDQAVAKLQLSPPDAQLPPLTGAGVGMPAATPGNTVVWDR